MKKILTLLAAVSAGFSAQAQWVSGPTPQRAIVPASGSVYVIIGNTTSNIPPSQAPVCRVGPNGFGISGTFGTTNSITNGTTMVFELIADIYGTNAVSSGNAQQPTMSFIVPAAGTAPFYYWTNIPGTSVNIGNVPGIRVKSFNPTNAANNLLITNLHIWSR